jgi:hypothetical protein
MRGFHFRDNIISLMLYLPGHIFFLIFQAVATGCNGLNNQFTIIISYTIDPQKFGKYISEPGATLQKLSI